MRKESPQLPQPNKTTENDDCIHFHQCHILKVIFLKGGLQIAAASQNCNCFSWCGLAVSVLTQLPASHQAAFELLKDISFPTIKRAFYKSREDLFLISWNGWNRQSWSKNDYEAGKWRHSECPSPMPPRFRQCSLPLGDALKRYA